MTGYIPANKRLQLESFLVLVLGVQGMSAAHILSVVSRILGAFVVVEISRLIFFWQISDVVQPIIDIVEVISIEFSNFIKFSIFNLASIFNIYEKVIIFLDEIKSHIFFLLTFYFVREAVPSILAIKDEKNKYRYRLLTVGILNLISGLLSIIFVISVLSIIINENDSFSSYFIGLGAVAAAQIYYFLGIICDSFLLRGYYSARFKTPKRKWLTFVGQGAITALRRMIIGSLMMIVAISLFGNLGVENPAAVSLAVVIFIFGLYWVRRAKRETYQYMPNANCDTTTLFAENVHAKLGGAILGIYAWALIILAFNFIVLEAS